MAYKRLALLRITAVTLTLLCSLVGSVAVSAATNSPRLRTNIIVEKSLVTLGDIFENAGPKANTAVFRAPDLGKSGEVGASRIQAAAKRHGLTWANQEHVATVQVTRASTQVSDDIVISAIENAIRARIGLAQSAELTVKLAGNDLPYHLPPGDSGNLEVARLDYNARTGYFRADLRAADGSRSQLQTSFRGQAIETIQVPVLVRSISRGEVIQASDIQHRVIARRLVRSGILRADSDVIGMAAKRSLQAEQPLRLEDMEPPKLVRRNTPVIIVYQHGGMTLSVRGRAIADGALGQLVSVMNIRSNRIIEGMVSGYGRVTVERLGAPRVSAAPQEKTTHLASSQ